MPWRAVLAALLLVKGNAGGVARDGANIDAGRRQRGDGGRGVRLFDEGCVWAVPATLGGGHVGALGGGHVGACSSRCPKVVGAREAEKGNGRCGPSWKARCALGAGSRGGTIVFRSCLVDGGA
jgi:hypothetical protein